MTEHIRLMYFHKNIQGQIMGIIEFAAWKFAIKMGTDKLI